MGLITKTALAAACGKYGNDIDLDHMPEPQDYREGTVARLLTDVFERIFLSNRVMDGEAEDEESDLL